MNDHVSDQNQDPSGDSVIEQETNQEVTNETTELPLDRHECRSCGYTYEPLKGDSAGKIPAMTRFEELPPSWRCPVCGAKPALFQNVGELGKASGFTENLDYGLGVNRMTPGQKNLLIFGFLALGIVFFLSLYGLR
jgi:rubredoxin